MRLSRVRVVIGFPSCSSAANGKAYFNALDPNMKKCYNILLFRHNLWIAEC